MTPNFSATCQWIIMVSLFGGILTGAYPLGGLKAYGQVRSPSQIPHHPRKMATFLPRMMRKTEMIKVNASRPIKVRINLPQGWQMNAAAPSWMALFQEKSQGDLKSKAQGRVSAPANKDTHINQAIQEYDSADLSSIFLTLPPLTSGASYRLQGTLYYCKKGKEALCAFESQNISIVVPESGATSVEAEGLENEIQIHLG